MFNLTWFVAILLGLLLCTTLIVCLCLVFCVLSVFWVLLFACFVAVFWVCGCVLFLCFADGLACWICLRGGI